jgi:protein-arginine kinase activator protein McsA
MISTNTLEAKPQFFWKRALPVLILVAGLAEAEEVQHLSTTVPGGMPGTPLITGMQLATNHVIVTWDGPSGYYQLFEKPELSGSWKPLGGNTNISRRAVLPLVYSNAMFRVSGPGPSYVGSQACLEFHTGIHKNVQATEHAQAFKVLKAGGQDKNSSCLPCHTVGYGLPTGFVSEAQTPQLAGVQCESCHGPAGNHAANPDDVAVRPRAEVASTVCGGCHTGSQQPTFEEWSASEHAEVAEPDLDANSCGRCHLGPVRIAMLKGQAVPQNEHTLGVVCATCHLPHRAQAYTNFLNGFINFTNTLTGRAITLANTNLGRVYTNQVRNPLASTKDYFLKTSDTFSNKYDPGINICGQCHNHRGASWTSNSRAPHHSPQYNMLLGTVGELDTGAAPQFPSTHSRLEKQCVTCHMQIQEPQYGPPQVPAVTGHQFTVTSFEVCAPCHGSASNAEGLVALSRQNITNQISFLQATLNYWATTQAPEALRTKYGTRSWEYTNPGDLSPGGPGPSSSEQALIPVNIRKARYNLYLVLYDGSFGAHNGPYAVTLLDTAQTWVEDELSP